MWKKNTGILTPKIKVRAVFSLLIALLFCFYSGCFIIRIPYKVVKGTVKGTYYVVKGAYELTAGTTKLVYHVAAEVEDLLEVRAESPHHGR